MVDGGDIVVIVCVIVLIGLEFVVVLECREKNFDFF